MKVVPLYCPNCGSPVGKDAKFCSQCGSPIIIEDDTQRSEHIVREIDEARIREATAEERIQLKKLEIQAEKERQKTEREKQLQRNYPFVLIFMIIAMILCFNFVRSLV